MAEPNKFWTGFWIGFLSEIGNHEEKNEDQDRIPYADSSTTEESVTEPDPEPVVAETPATTMVTAEAPPEMPSLATMEWNPDYSNWAKQARPGVIVFVCSVAAALMMWSRDRGIAVLLLVVGGSAIAWALLVLKS